MRYTMTSILTLTVLTAAGCERPEQEIEQEFEPGTEVAMDTVTGEDVESFRSQVQEALRTTQDELEELGSRVADRTEEGWESLSQRAEDVWADVGESLDRAGNGDADDLARNREDTAERLAELDGGMASAEVKTASTPEELLEIARQRIERLQADLAELESALALQGTAAANVDSDEVQDLRERLAELNREVDELAAIGADEFEDRRDGLADKFEDVTQEVRAQHYLVQWS